MPQIIYTDQSQRDLNRFYQFLIKKDKAVAIRAIKTIRAAIKEIRKMPEGYRPVPNLPNHREIIIDFGASGYVGRFRYIQGGDIYIVRIKHQLEDE
jgi:plasmid stabilization system protein ParE